MDSDVQDWAKTIRRCQPIANLRFEEPHAGNPLVRDCGGLGRVTAQGYPAKPTLRMPSSQSAKCRHTVGVGRRSAGQLSAMVGLCIANKLEVDNG